MAGSASEVEREGWRGAAGWGAVAGSGGVGAVAGSGGEGS
jgi:hypothetical protein